MHPDAFAVHHVDSEPTVAINQWNAYRIVISKLVRKDLPNPNPSPRGPTPFTNLTEFVEIVLVPMNQHSPPDLTARIPWSDFNSMYHVQSVDMGTGFGFRWFGRMNLWEQDDMRERLGLVGGDNRRALAEQGLTVQDKGNMTRNSMQCRMRRFDEEKESNRVPAD